MLDWFVDRNSFLYKRNLTFVYKPTDLYCFLISGFTKFDLVANLISFALVRALHLLFLTEFFIYILFPCADSYIAQPVSKIENKWIGLPASVFVGLMWVVFYAVRIPLEVVKHYFFIPLISVVLHVALRVVSTPLGLLSAPFYLAGQTIYNSDTPVQTAVKGIGVLSLVVSKGLWIALAAGVFTPAVLGMSALAMSLIALAKPVAVVSGVAGVAALLGVGLYSVCCSFVALDPVEGASTKGQTAELVGPSH